MNLRRSSAYFIAFGFRTLRREWRTLLQTALSMSVTFFLVFSLLTFFKNLREGLVRLKSDHRVIVYLADSAKPDELFKTIKKRYCKYDWVKRCEQLSRAQAKKHFLKKHSQMESILKSLDQNPFSYSIEIDVQNIEQSLEDMQDMLFDLERLSGVEDLFASLGEASSWSRAIRLLDVFFVFLSCIALASIMMVIFNAIGVLVFSRRREIEVLSLVGATDFMLSIPFFLNSIAITGVAFVLAMALLALGRYFFTEHLFILMHIDFIRISQLSGLQWGILMCASFFLSVLGAYSAVKRFIK